MLHILPKITQLVNGQADTRTQLSLCNVLSLKTNLKMHTGIAGDLAVAHSVFGSY